MGNRMIHYSVYTQSNPLNRDEKAKTYAKSQIIRRCSLDEFALIVSRHGGFSKGLVKGVLSDVSTCLAALLLEGAKVDLGELGSFYVSLSCEGAASPAAFTPKHIKAVKAQFIPGEDLNNLTKRAEFKLAINRTLQKMH